MTRPWAMHQRWEDLLFCSWPVEAESLRRFVPAGVEIDVAEGSAWISAVPFWMERARFRRLPPLPFINSFPEVNLRTYVRAGDQGAVWFLSLDTESRVNVAIARAGFGLPYVHANVRMRRGSEVEFRSVRPGGEAAFEVRYRPSGDEFVPGEGSLEHFLTERYAMVCARGDGTLYRGDIRHPVWRLRGAEWSATSLELLPASGFDLTGKEPLVFFSAATEVFLWRPVRV